jgi:RNA polymerase sigma-70 factor (ECF subfamily)
MTVTSLVGAAMGSAPGSTDGFATWVRPHLALMARLAARLAPDADRDDIVQEALARAWTKRRHYDPGRGTPAAWLLALTADQAGKARRRLRAVPAPLDANRHPQPSGLSRDDALDVERAVRALPRRQRLAVDCFYFAGLSVAETAAVMACAEGTVKSTLSDARARLRPLLEVTE